MMTANSAPKPEECNCFVVRSAARHVTQLYDQFLAPIGLRVTQFSILAILKRLGPLTINALAKQLVMDRTTLGRNILPLERDGLIRVSASVGDGRAKELDQGRRETPARRHRRVVAGTSAVCERFRRQARG